MTVVFAIALTSGLLLKFWLASRQIRHVARHRNAVPTEFSAQVTLQAHQKAADYTVTQARFGMLELAWGAATTTGWTLLGGLQHLNHWLLGEIPAGLWQQLALLAAFVLINALLDLPFTLYKTFVIEQRFGFNKTTPALWLQDTFKALLLSSVLGLPLAALILWLMGASGTYWWLWTWCTRVNALMARCGFSAKGFYVMDGSKRSAHANAYFTGLGNSKRVVFFDTLLAQLDAGEVDAVLAHELGHFKHRHVPKRMVSMFAMSLAGFGLLGWLSNQIWFYTGLGVLPNWEGANSALALLLFLLFIPLLTSFVTPLFSQLSRRHEFEADAYAVAQTSGADLSHALLKLYKDNASTLTPDPLYVKFYYSHPPAFERLARMRGTVAGHA